MVESFKQACDRGSEIGCAELAQMIEWGRADAGISAKALYEALCSTGTKQGCDLKQRLEELEAIAAENPCPDVSAGSASAPIDAGSEGGLSKSSIARVASLHRDEIRYCYDRALKVSPLFEGKIKVKFQIGPSGSVLAADVAEDTVRNPDVQLCLVEQIRRWRFPCPKGGGNVTVVYPWIFKPPRS